MRAAAELRLDRHADAIEPWRDGAAGRSLPGEARKNVAVALEPAVARAMARAMQLPSVSSLSLETRRKLAAFGGTIS